jgi:hypothetical protein
MDMKPAFIAAAAIWSIRGNAWTRSSTQQQQRRLLSEAYPKLGKAL